MESGEKQPHDFCICRKLSLCPQIEQEKRIPLETAIRTIWYLIFPVFMVRFIIIPIIVNAHWWVHLWRHSQRGHWVGSCTLNVLDMVLLNRKLGKINGENASWTLVFPFIVLFSSWSSLKEQLCSLTCPWHYNILLKYKEANTME